MRDLQIIPDESGRVTFSVVGASEDNGLLLLQRLYVLLLSDTDEAYRDGADGYSLLKFIEGGNIPSAGVLDSVLAISCATALNSLDPEDRAVVQSFTGATTTTGIVCSLLLTDGTTIKGLLNND